MKNKLNGLIRLGVILLLLSFASAASADARVQAAAKDFMRLHGQDVVLKFSADSGALEIARNFMSRPLGMKNIRENTRTYLLDMAPLLGLGKLDNISFTTSVKAGPNRLFKYEQYHAGLPVFGKTVAAMVSDSGRVRLVRSDLASLDDMVVEASVSLAEAVAKALERRPDGELSTEPVLGLLPMGDSRAIPAWQVYVRAEGPSMWEVYINAETGKVIFGYDRIVHANQADVYTENPVATPDLKRVELKHRDPAQPYLDGEYAHVFSCEEMGPYGCMSETRRAMEDPVSDGGPDSSPGDFLHYDPIIDSFNNEDPFAEVAAYYHTTDMNTWVRDTVGYDGEYGTGHKWIKAIVNYDYQNAFFAGGYGGQEESINFGYFGNSNFAYDGDVIGHEFGHSVNHNTASLGMGIDDKGMEMTSMGNDEGYADLITYVRHQNPKLGEFAFGGSGARHGDNDHVCPDDLSGETHEDGYITSAVGWEIYDALGIKGYELMYRALAASGPSMNELADSIESMADIMKDDGEITAADVDAVYAAVENHNFHGCDRLVPLTDEDGNPTETRMASCMAPYYGDAVYGMPFAVQHYVVTQPATKNVIIRLGATMYSGRQNFYVRTGEYVQWMWGSSSGYGMPPLDDIVADVKFMADDYDEPVMELELNKYTMGEAFVPGESIYVSMAGVAEGMSQMLVYMISAELSDEEADPPPGYYDAGTDGGEEEEDDDDNADDGDASPADGGDGGLQEEGGSSGCGCTVAGRSSSGSSFFTIIKSFISVL